MKTLIQKNLRSLTPFLIFAAVSGAFAFWSALPKKDSDTERTAYISLNPKQIATIETSGIEQKVVAKRINDERFLFSKIKGDTETKFVSARRVKESLDYFAPLETLRKLGKLTDEQRKTFGLAPARSSIKILSTSGEILLDLEIGQKTYGSNNFYAADRKTGEGLIVLSEVFEDFDSAEVRLIERSLFDLSSEEALSVEVTKKSGQRTAYVKKSDAKKEINWVLESNPSEVKANVKAWLEKVERLRSEKFRFDKERKDFTGPPEFIVTFKQGSKNSQLSVWKDGEGWIGYVNVLDAFVQLPADRMGGIASDAQNL